MAFLNLDIEQITTDALALTNAFLDQAFAANASVAQDRADARAQCIGPMVAYLKTDTSCGYETSKRILQQTWDDHFRTNGQPHDSAVELVNRFSLTPHFQQVLTMIDNSMHMGGKATVAPSEVLGVLVVFCGELKERGSLKSEARLGRGNLSASADAINQKLLKQVANHVLALSPDAAAVLSNPTQALLATVANAQACRAALVAALETDVVIGVGQAIEEMDKNTDQQVGIAPRRMKAG